MLPSENLLSFMRALFRHDLRHQKATIGENPQQLATCIGTLSVREKVRFELDGTVREASLSRAKGNIHGAQQQVRLDHLVVVEATVDGEDLSGNVGCVRGQENFATSFAIAFVKPVTPGLEAA